MVWNGMRLALSVCLNSYYNIIKYSRNNKYNLAISHRAPLEQSAAGHRMTAGPNGERGGGCMAVGAKGSQWKMCLPCQSRANSPTTWSTIQYYCSIRPKQTELLYCMLECQMSAAPGTHPLSQSASVTALVKTENYRIQWDWHNDEYFPCHSLILIWRDATTPPPGWLSVRSTG